VIDIAWQSIKNKRLVTGMNTPSFRNQLAQQIGQTSGDVARALPKWRR